MKKASIDIGSISCVLLVAEIINGKFFVHAPKRYTSEGDGCCTIVADYNIPKEFIKEIEETTTWTFNKEPNG